MNKKNTTSIGLFRFLLASSLSLILLIILNFTSNYFWEKSILILIIMLFLPGYLLVNIIFEKKPEILEIVILSIGISIGLYILVAMGVHFAGMKITVVNILNPVAALSLILGLLDFLKNILITKKLHRVRV